MYSDAILLDKLGPICDVIVLFTFVKRHDLEATCCVDFGCVISCIEAYSTDVVNRTGSQAYLQVHTEFNHHITQHTTIVASPVKEQNVSWLLKQGQGCLGICPEVRCSNPIRNETQISEILDDLNMLLNLRSMGRWSYEGWVWIFGLSNDTWSQ